MAEILDIDAFIDYMILNQYGGNLDWDSHNWYAYRRREPNGKFYWIAWDSEFIFIDKNDNVLREDSGPGGKGPGHLFLKLVDNQDFRNRFADRVTEHFFGDGALTPENVIERWNTLSASAVDAVVAESARWGDYRRDIDRGLAPLELYERDVQWMAERNRLLNDYLPQRSGIVLAQYIDRGLYTDIPVPIFSQDGGSVPSAYELSMSSASGSVFYTLDGSDPMSHSATVESTTLLAPAAAARAFVPADDSLSHEWTTLAFDDSAWKGGSTGAGYERRSGYESLLGLDLGAEMYDKNASAFLRVPFAVRDTITIERLVLYLQYDDGFVAYLNGVEVARRNAPEATAWNSSAVASRSDRLAMEPEAINISAFLHMLQPGDNVLAIHGLNGRVRDDDFLIVPELTGGIVTQTGASASAFRYSQPVVLDQDTVIKARTLLGGDWSAVNEANFTITTKQPTLRITELMYHPAAPTNAERAAGFDDADDFEFLEIVNVGDEMVELTEIQLIQGVSFDFRSSDIRQLAPGQRVVVVEDLAAFRLRYGNRPLVAGQWTGQLNNDGEEIELVAEGIPLSALCLSRRLVSGHRW